MWFTIAKNPSPAEEEEKAPGCSRLRPLTCCPQARESRFLHWGPRGRLGGERAMGKQAGLKPVFTTRLF